MPHAREAQLSCQRSLSSAAREPRAHCRAAREHCEKCRSPTVVRRSFARLSRPTTFSLIVWQYITGWRKFDSAASRTSDRARCGPAVAAPTRAVQSDHPPNRIIIISLRAFGTAESFELSFFAFGFDSRRIESVALRSRPIISVAPPRRQPVQGKGRRQPVAAGHGRSDGREPSLDAARTRTRTRTRTRKANNRPIDQTARCNADVLAV